LYNAIYSVKSAQIARHILQSCGFPFYSIGRVSTPIFSVEHLLLLYYPSLSENFEVSVAQFSAIVASALLRKNHAAMTRLLQRCVALDWLSQISAAHISPAKSVGFVSRHSCEKHLMNLQAVTVTWRADDGALGPTAEGDSSPR
jgi:hypothetical protein